MRHIRISAVAVAAIAALAGCRDSGPADNYALDGRLVVFNYRVATARFLVNLKHLRTPSAGETAIARFEDPSGGAPIELREKIWATSPKTTFTTPPLRCIVKDRPYRVEIQIVNGDGEVIQNLETSVVSSQDQTRFPDKPLVVGPFYTRNPEMKNRSAEDLAKAAREGCPSM
ncbi:MAG: hypothetical protein KF874_10740 [Rhizobiaceae bacterium]|nr:hypothetical protein [Rhizobiaceae bacterium]